MNKIKSMLLVALMLSPYLSAQKITMDVHRVALVDVLYELANAAKINLVLTHALDVEISIVLQDVDPKTGLELVCNAIEVNCQYTQNGLVVGAATEQSNTTVLPLHTVKLSYGEADAILLTLQGAQPMLSPKGQLLADSRSQQIVVYDDAAHATALMEVITQLDQPLQQLLIEGRIVIAKSSLSESSGLDFIGGLGPSVAVGAANGGQVGAAFNQLGGGLQLGLVAPPCHVEHGVGGSGGQWPSAHIGAATNISTRRICRQHPNRPRSALSSGYEQWPATRMEANGTWANGNAQSVARGPGAARPIGSAGRYW